VRLSSQELTDLAAHLGLEEIDFIQRYMRLAADRRGLALDERPDGACILLHGTDCLVQPVKPKQCREFPHLWNFPGFEKICRATRHELTPEESP
jgi:uncharacterized protein